MAAYAISLLKGYHITATEKRHISEVLESGQKCGATSKMRLEILSQHDQIYEIAIHTRERDSLNRLVPRRSLVTVKAVPRPVK
ncbi:hypothetical protein [Pseudochrobactrum sp. AO18b]|uniref:hypothetical protein n=1 Tax=Pseudochrobactrum sp. AO18b TaxID=1201036 RepID=UPI000399FF2B|nr:hypothetical protein [Pseudochrobactrum sp. AO18b]